MKKLLKILGIIVGVFILVVVLIVVFISASGLPEYDVPKVEYRAIPGADKLERGRILVATLCAGCHRNPQTGKLVGRLMTDAPQEFGTIYSTNITRDPDVGIGNWTDAEIMVLLRTGIGKDGRYRPPYMAKLPHLSDYDMEAVISFLKSDHPMVAADPTPDNPCEPSLLTKALSRGPFKPFPMPDHAIANPDTSNSVEWGRYLAVNFECFSCHSADFVTNDYLNPEKSVGYMAGGNKPLDEQGNAMPTSNLTPDADTGIGNWSRERFIKAVKYGQMEGEPALRYPMQPYSLLSDSEVGAIYDYLMTLEPVANNVTRAGM